MINIFRNATPWLLAVLIGIAVYSGMLAKQYSAERDLAQAHVQRTRERNERMRSLMEWQREQMGTMYRALRERDQQIARDAEHIDGSRESAVELERNDDQVAEWAGRDVDGSIVEWLRQLREAGADAVDSIASGAGVPDEPAARTEQGD